MKRYKGLCIGGVADGQVYEHDKPEFHVEARRKLPDGSFEKTGQETNYAYLLLLGNIRQDYGVWVPQGASVEWVIDKLLGAYRSAAFFRKNPPQFIQPGPLTLPS